MKFSYNPNAQEFIVSELGRIIDSDKDFDAIAIRNGYIVDEEEKTTSSEQNNQNQEEKE